MNNSIFNPESVNRTRYLSCKWQELRCTSLPVAPNRSSVKLLLVRTSTSCVLSVVCYTGSRKHSDNRSHLLRICYVCNTKHFEISLVLLSRQLINMIILIKYQTYSKIYIYIYYTSERYLNRLSIIC